MTTPDVHPRQCQAHERHGEHFWETPHLGWRYCRGIGHVSTPVPVPPTSDVVTEHAIAMTDGGMHVRNPAPHIERVYPLSQWIPDRQRHGGKVWRRRVVVVEDWVEVPKNSGGGRA